MASVLLARDPLMKRQVAIKVLPKQFLFDPQFRARFDREAQVIAALEHPNIVPLHDFGEDSETGQPFIVMRCMTGGSLLDRVKKGRLSLEQIARLVARVAGALGEAHRQGIVHRDLKPGNILFDSRGDAYLSDFGIAKIAEATAALTGSNIIGTPAYMSPEQASAVKEIDGRSDIYSLGVVLFELLAGSPPFKSDTPMGVAVAHITEPVPSICAARPDLTSGWEDLINRAMAKNPGGRFQTAGELADAVATLAGVGASGSLSAQKIPSGSPAAPTREDASVVTAVSRPASQAAALSRSASASRRVRWFLALGIFLIAIFVIAVAASGAALFAARNGVATRVSSIVEPASTATTVPLVSTQAASPTASTIASSATEAPASPPAASTLTFTTLPAWGEGHIYSAAWSPDGRMLAIGTAGGVFVCDPETLELKWRTDKENFLSIWRVIYSPDGSMVFGASEKSVFAWDAATGEQKQEWPTRFRPTAITLNPDGAQLAVGDENGGVEIWNAASGQVIEPVVGLPAGQVSSLDFSADGGRLTIVQGVFGDSARIWDVAGSRITQSFDDLPSADHIAAFPDGSKLAMAGRRGVEIWDVNRREQINTFGAGDDVDYIVVSADGGVMAAGARDADYNGLVRVWNARTGGLIQTLPVGSRSVLTNSFLNEDGSRIAVLNQDANTVQIFDVVSGRRLQQFGWDWAYGLVFTPSGQLAVGGIGGFQFWDVGAGRLMYAISGDYHVDNSNDLTGFGGHDLILTPDSRFLASALSSRIVLYDPATGLPQRVLAETSGDINAFAFTPDGSLAAVGTDESSISLLDTTTGERRRILTGFKGSVLALAYSLTDDGRTLASGGSDPTIRIWDAKLGQLVRTLEGHTDSVNDLAFNPDATLLASAGADGTVRLWSSETGETRSTLDDLGGSASAVVFSPDGRLLAVATERDVVVWDIVARSLAHRLPAYPDYYEDQAMIALAFDPAFSNGYRLVAGGYDTRLWELPAR